MVDSATLTALGGEIVYGRWFAFLDIVGDPVRAVSALAPITFGAAETGDPDLDGETFIGLPPRLINIGDVQHSEAGSETVEATLSALPLVDTDINTILNDKSLWRKRKARLWFLATEENGTPIGSMVPYYSGYIQRMVLESSRESQTITVAIENFISVLMQASNLTYLHQGEFDASDKSAEQTLAAVNGMGKAGVPSGSSGGGGSSRPGGIGSNYVNYL